MYLEYNHELGLQVDGTPLPDPKKWNYQVGDLDTSGSRDATGLLHRAYVATKINYEFEWNALEWEVLQGILRAVNKEKFTLVAPDPRDMDHEYRGSYYVGDRTGSNHYFRPGSTEKAFFSLKLKFIEY